MLADSFLDYLRYERNYSEKTVLAYGEDISQLQEFAQEEIGEFNPLEVKPELIREWIVSLMDRGILQLLWIVSWVRSGRFINISSDKERWVLIRYVK